MTPAGDSKNCAEVEGFNFQIFWRLDIGVCDLHAATPPVL
jgi:hypothetical protein